MKYRNSIITFGFLVLVAKYSGFPSAWREALYVLFGLAIIVLAYLSGKESKPKSHEPIPDSLINN